MTSRLHHQLATYEVNIGGNLRMNIDIYQSGSSSTLYSPPEVGYSPVRRLGVGRRAPGGDGSAYQLRSS
jgi:hypothetical protein